MESHIHLHHLPGCTNLTLCIEAVHMCSRSLEVADRRTTNHLPLRRHAGLLLLSDW